MEAIKKLIIIGILLYAGYFALTHHFIFFGSKVKILTKIEPKITMDYTFFSVGTTPKDVEYIGLDTILAIKPLRAAGIGELIVSMELATEEQKQKAEAKVDSAP